MTAHNKKGTVKPVPQPRPSWAEGTIAHTIERYGVNPVDLPRGATKASLRCNIVVVSCLGGTTQMGTTMSIALDTAHSSAPTERPLQAAAKPFIRRVWPQAVVGLGLGLSMAWTILLGYGLIRLVESVI